ncbi:putative acyl-CoA dehydrogenase AidB [Rhodococcus sp. RD6.2]|jgi:putative acyl-CoA dehydrogenase|uniref:acyl-CoA dehydrogenase family protein n=1 Tax=Rhodococcus sp. RD6.2 TaxID=260936 RepID=UPI00063B14F4|nr:acyl-CoA dehydrogenase family protein [Rhodococcus sp. RD6.2]CRK52096.1 putative acyl-CoA dehydrogenase AidB [Rhodococcus sp. RD6.2]
MTATAPTGFRTHEVFNQAPPRIDVNEYATNLPLVEGVARYDADWANDELSAVGALVGTESFQHDAELANTITPEFHSHDRYGNRIDEVEFHPAYHRIIGAAVEHGAHTSAWADPKPGANVARAASFMLFAQVEPGHACPISMTHSAVPAIGLSPDLADVWLPRLYGRGYDGNLVAPGDKPGVLLGMAMTEKQGGSDVRANTTRAVPNSDGTWSLTGHKWFCSAPMSDGFLILAQTDHGGGSALSCFLVPRVLEDGTRNVFRIQRLKDKLGNKSNASSEIELDGTIGHLVGEPGRGVRTIIEMVARTRLDCVYGSTAGMRQSVAEALWHVRHRSAFGATLIDQPAMTAVAADLALESEAATATALRLARAHDDDADETEKAFRRLATAVAKYWICKRGPHHAYESLECLGGNGYTEAFPLARRYREQPVMAVWEGSGNVIALDVLRAMTREPESVAAFDAELAGARGASTLFDTHHDRMRAALTELATLDPARAQLRARPVAASMALGLQGALLLKTAPTAVAEAFLAARLGEDRDLEYGSLPAGTDFATILERH